MSKLKGVPRYEASELKCGHLCVIVIQGQFIMLLDDDWRNDWQSSYGG